MKPLLKKKENLPILFILSLSFILVACGVWWGLPGSRGWASDELIPSIIFKAVESHFDHGWFHVYPPFHYYLLALIYSPFYVIHKFGLIDIFNYSFHTILFFLGRFISIIYGVATVYVIYLWALEIFDRKASLFAALIASLMPPFIFYAKIANVDIPYIFWITLSLFFYTRIQKKYRLLDYLFFAGAGSLAICTKYQAYGFYILTPLAIVFSHHLAKKKQNPQARFIHSLIDRKIILSFLLAVLIFLLVHNVFFNFQGFLNNVKWAAGPGKSYPRIYENTIVGHSTMLWQTLKHLRFSLGWPLFLACGLGLFTSILQRKKNKLLLWTLIPGTSYYIFFISFILANYDRYLIPLGIILSLFGGKFLSEFLNPAQRFYKIKIGIVSLSIIYTFLYAGSLDILMHKDSRYKVEKWMKQNLPPNSLVGVIDSKEYLPRLENYKWILMTPNFRHLEQIKPDYLILNSEYGYRVDKNHKGYRFDFELSQGRAPYKLVLDYKYWSKFAFINFDGIDTQLSKINPRIKIFKRITAFPS